MFGYLIKSFPSKYIFAGYSVRRSLTVMTSVINNNVVYDVFEFSYVDNYLSFYLLMEDGSYKCVEAKVNVPAVDGQQLLTKHIYRGTYYDISDEEAPDKNTICGVFGLRGVEDLVKQINEMEAKDKSDDEDGIGTGIDSSRSAYSGIEVMGLINRFNRDLKWEKGIITVPALKKDANDTYESAIGDEMDFFDFMSNKTSDEIIRDLKKIDDSLDGVGNKKS